MAVVDLIAGARPNFMKIAPLIKALSNSKKDLTYRLIHTGQHYDAGMSGSFFEQLAIPQPDCNFGVGSGTQAEQTAGIMIAYEQLLVDKPSDACIVVGDVTSTMATAIVAQKLGVPVAHVEGGIRSGDWGMPEEINRRVTDAISNWFFTTSVHANENLAAEGASEDRVFFVGNTMIDTLLTNMERLRQPDCWGELGLEKGSYIVLTMHRPANVDGGEKLEMALRKIGAFCEQVPIVFPVHPRTAQKLKSVSELPKNLHMVEPQPYLEFNFLVKNAMAVITDSGGITEETTVMGVPCMTLRDNTERPETISVGTNELVGTNPDNLAPYVEKLFAGEWKQGGIPAKWDGKAGERIVAHLERLLCP